MQILNESRISYQITFGPDNKKSTQHKPSDRAQPLLLLDCLPALTKHLP